MVRFSKSSALFAFSHCLTFKHVFASPDPIKSVTGPTSHPIYHLQVRADPNDPECHVEPYNAPQITKQTFPPFDPAIAHIYRYRQQQSVNLGSWFVHEKWMTPSLFSCASGRQEAEIDIAYGWWSIDNARIVLERHWDTFINETDFQYLASIGINTVRLPIGYWNLGPDFMQGTAFEFVAQVYRDCWPRIVRAINQAGHFGIGVLVDLHGAVGSQNGQHHSGISDGATNLFSVPSNMDKTVDVLTFLAQKLAGVNNVVGIQILNEPQYVDSLTDFYSRAIARIREAPLAETLPLYLHDGFDLDRFSDYIVGRTDFVVQDHHSYFVFTDSDRLEKASQHTANVQGGIADSLSRVSGRQRRNLVIDEWSCALTQESLQNEDDVDQVRKDFCTTQLNVYRNTTAGWSFWSYKKEACDPDWCFLAAVGHRLPSTFFSYPSDSPSLGRRSDGVATSPTYHHRFDSIRQRRDGMEQYLAEVQPSRGYSDGFTTAKAFASKNMSRLGFTGQYIKDEIKKAGPSLIAPGTEKDYTDVFMQGLLAGERTVVAEAASQNSLFIGIVVL
ncbi:glycoside hydrolase [Phlegmacium glaucopus]|nr:glycoside hydrolase [Phlegmacium glaucopus]